MADQVILREYLLSLGFKINETQHKKFNGVVEKSDVKLAFLGKTAVAAATSIVTFTTLFAKSMERLYYSSRYAGTTASNLQALEFGAQQIGLKAGGATQAVTNMAAALRANPGLVGLLEGKFGIQVTGRKMDEVLLDLVRVLRQMPPYIGQQFAALFGISPEDLFNLGLGVEKLEKAQELHKQMARDMGLDLDQAAEMGLKYANLWETITTQAGMFAKVLGVALLPHMEKLAGYVHDVMTDWSKFVRDAAKPGGVEKVVQGTVDEVLGGFRNSPMMKDWERFQKWRDENAKRRGGIPLPAPDTASPSAPALPAQSPSGKVPTAAGASSEGGSEVQKLTALEKKYALPPGLLVRVWTAESNRGQNLLSPKGAMGPFQFMKETGPSYGLKDEEDYYDFDKSSEAAARMWAERIKARGGDVRAAAYDYNWGAGNVAKYGLGRAPKEANDYADKVAGPAVTVKNDTTINIYGAEKPQEAAQAVAGAMETVNAETVRNFAPKVR
jgi:soluble lytic murein transglycosylase-like protein